MTWTYNDPSASAKDAIRLMIGDTNFSDQKLSDEEISFIATPYPTNNYRAAAECCRFLAAKYANVVDSSIESVRVSGSQISANYLKLADNLFGKAGIADGSDPSSSGGVLTAYVGGVTVSDYVQVAEDPERLQPFFTRNQFDNPSTVEW